MRNCDVVAVGLASRDEVHSPASLVPASRWSTSTSVSCRDEVHSPASLVQVDWVGPEVSVHSALRAALDTQVVDGADSTLDFQS